MSDPNDADELRALVAAAQRHSPDAWDQLYRRCRPKLVAYARRRLPTLQAAEDAVSEAFVRAIGRIDGFSWRGAGFEAWMYGITRNVVHEAHRSMSRDSRMEAEQGAAVASTGPEPDPIGAAIEDAGDREQLRAAFARLGEDDREILELRVVAGLDAEQVAAVVGKRAGAVRMAQSRALQRLRDLMTEVRDG